jgi:membrane-bound serine protease (ClpP class)
MNKTGIALLLCVLFACGGRAADVREPGTTVIIPIHDMIERGLVYVVRRGVAEAERRGAGAIILDMDTPGGRLDATEEILHLLTSARMKTYTYVNPNAISAGAITAFATDHIYMAPGGRIGDAMPIIMSPLPFSGPQEVPEGLKEKMVSPTAALIRSVAEQKGHDKDLAEAMVRPELEYRVGERVICPVGQLLTLTSAEAAEPLREGGRPLLSSGTVASLDELLERIGRADDRIVRIETTAAERIARIIEGFPVSGLLLAAGLLCLYIEFKTPGFGIPGIAGILLLTVWFWGHHVAGLAGMAEVLLFMCGLALLLVEIFVTPGFGVLGFAGLVFMTASLLMAMVQHYPSGPLLPPVYQLTRAVKVLGSTCVITFAVGALLARFLPEAPGVRRLVLQSAAGAADGFRAARGRDDWIGRTGSAVTALHPSGIGLFEQRRVDVVTLGTYVEAGAPIRIVDVHGNRVVVEPAAPPDTPPETTKETPPL